MKSFDSTDLVFQTASQLAALIRAREISPVAVAEAFFHHIAKINPPLNACVTIPSAVVGEEKEADREIRGGAAIGLLHGVPLTIKATIDTGGWPTPGGSLWRAERPPQRDAPAVARLKAAGAIILG